MKAKVINLKKPVIGKNFTMIDNMLINEHMNNLNLRELKVLLFLSYYNPKDSIKLTKPVLCKGTNQQKDDLNKTLKSLSEKGFIKVEGINITVMPLFKVKSFSKSEGKLPSYDISENSIEGKKPSYSEGKLPSYVEGEKPSYIEGENMPETLINKEIPEVENLAYNTNINKTKENNTNKNVYNENNVYSIIGSLDSDLDDTSIENDFDLDLNLEINTSIEENNLNHIPSDLNMNLSLTGLNSDLNKENNTNTSNINISSNLSLTGLNSDNISSTSTQDGKFNFEYLSEHSIKFNGIAKVFEGVKRDYFNTQIIMSIIQDIGEINPILSGDKFQVEKQKILDLYRITENDYVYLKYLVKYSIYMHKDFENGEYTFDNPLGKSLSNINTNKFLQDAA